MPNARSVFYLKQVIMGCDVHMFTEVKNKNWEFVKDKFPYEYYNDKEPESKWNNKLSSQFYHGRNYFLFALLADVRNKYEVEPIDRLRGLPDDISKLTKKEYDQWEGGGHSCSWYTLKEILEFDWNKLNEFTGVVNYEEFKSFLENGEPKGWCEAKSMGSGRIEIMTPQEMKSMHEANYSFHTEDIRMGWNTVITWKKEYREYCKDFIERLELLKELGSPENVRIVFWFDS